MIRTTIAAALLAIAATAFAQKPAEKPAVTPQADSIGTRSDLQSILRAYPPEVGAVLKLDPTLFGNASYMANYPALASFVTDHPEVAHNPAFFLQNVAMPGGWEGRSGSMLRDIMSDLGGFTAFLVLTAVFVWVIRILIEQRRWNRTMHMQTEAHGKLLDRLTSNEDLKAYMQSPAGRRFLESAAIPLESAPRPMSAPIGRMFWSLQVGLIAIAFGIGFDIVSMKTQGDGATVLYGLGVTGILVGLAFVVSAIIFYILSRRFGLFEPPPVHDAQ